MHFKILRSMAICNKPKRRIFANNGLWLLEMISEPDMELEMISEPDMGLEMISEPDMG